VVYVTGAQDGRIAVAALRAGAADYVIKDVSEDFTSLLRSALEDALGCEFVEVDVLIRFLIELEVHGDDDPVLDDTPQAPEPSLEAVRKSLAGKERVILHGGRRLVLQRREVLEGRRNDLNLVVHYTRLPGRRGFVIGGLADQPAE
jgi:hypothetical protein